MVLIWHLMSPISTDASSINMESVQTFDHNQVESSHRSVRQIVEWIFFILKIDLFLIYRDTFRGASSAKYRIYQLPELRLESNSFDTIRAKCNIVTRIVFTYLPIKFIFTAMQTVFDRINLNSRPTIDLDLGMYSQYIITYLLGRPLATIPGASVFVYTAVALTIFNGYILCPSNFLHKPIQFTTMRFLIDPKREIRRIDIMAGNFLKDFMFIKSNVIDDSSSDRTVSNARNSLSTSDKTASIQSTVALDQLNHISELRPATHNEQYFIRAHHILFIAIVVLTSGVVISSFVLPLAVVPIAKQRNCLAKNIPLSACSLKDAFNVQEMVALGEITFGVSAGCIVFFSFTIIIIINLFSQFTLATSVEEDLIKCLEVVCNFREDREMRNSMGEFNINFNTPTRSSLSFTDSYHSRMSANTSLNRQFRTTKDLIRQVETTLLRTLVKLAISEREIKECAQANGKFVEAILLSMGVSLIGAFIGMKVDGDQMRVFRNIALLFIWLATNGVLLGCAYVFSRTIRVEKQAWSILAHLKAEEIKISKDRLIYGISLGRGAFDEALVDRWTRLVTSYGLSDGRISVRPFGLSITYGRTLRINFLALSLASLILLF